MSWVELAIWQLFGLVLILDTASVSVSAVVAVVGSAAAHPLRTAAAPFPSMYSALSSSIGCCSTFLRALLLLVLLE